ncbi:amidase [Ureibacillus chungkukjangi]|uniref:Amidase n=1 Tax=Ureibacillus chungkukjangi TaxID=1202712 RepID=A0A318TZV9_9BACL|nr:amidase [Ureibacillus chungkukjangi]PYF08518.1 amidase [Ureibacillus chungkukjangi]
MDSNAFFDGTFTLPAKGEGKLSGKTFAVKDVFAVEGHRNSAGNPTWLETHEASKSTAPCIERLLENGAALQGMTHTDELMYSLNGENIHYGTPVNPVNPNCIPGGSSSGSASAVANGLVSFALGTDTGGSVRVPSSYCGLFGIRPTHDAVSLEGVIPLAPSFDTVGWMAKDIETLEAVGEVLLPETELSEFNRFFMEKAMWGQLAQEDREVLLSAVPKELLIENITLESKELTKWPHLFKYIQGVEAWRAHGEWIRETNPTFSAAIDGRFKDASKLDASGYENAVNSKDEIAEFMNRLLGDNGVLVLPTAASVAPVKNAPAESVESIRAMTMQLTCIGGIAGLPQVTVPVFREDGMALGLSFIASEGQDRSLLKFVRQLFGGSSHESSNH